MRALVTGGGGFLGRAITEMLLQRGDAVTILSRSRYPEVEALGATGVAHDLSTDAPGLEQILDGVDVVFHVAAKAGVWGPRDRFWSINVDGTRRLLDAAKAAGVGRFVYTSSPSAVWSGDDEVNLSEADCPYPETYLTTYPETKATAEKMALAENRDGFLTTSLRPHLIWGPRDPHLIPRLLDRGQKGRLRVVGEGKNKVGITYVDNAAWAHLLAADELSGEAKNAGKAYFITDDEPVDLWPWINDLFTALDIPTVTKRISTANAVRAGAAAEWIWRTFGRAGEPPMTRFVARQLSTHHHYDLSAARNDFGYHQKIDPKLGWDQMIQWFKENPITAS
ncbi:MAG: NAD-dependent epimerase/dehydratase family protein [Myxococcota bacterium]